VACFVLAAGVLATVNAQPASITANPNPVPLPGSQGTTAIRWTTGTGEDGLVMVAVDGGPERLLARGPSGSAEAAWIVPASTFEFRLYSATEPRRLLGTVAVRAADAALTPSSRQPIITARPNPVPSGPEGLGTEIAWDTGDGSFGRVMVSVDGQPPGLFAEGARGAAFADWIVKNRTYEFRLYREPALTESVASVVVTRPLPRMTESRLFRVGAVSVLALVTAAVWLSFRKPEEPLI
jgi:hypothetical protein